MKITTIILCGMIAIGGASSSWAASDHPSSEDVIRFLKDTDSRLGQADIALNGCQLSISDEQTNADSNMVQRVALEADLRQLSLQVANIQDLGTRGAVLTIARKSASAPLVAQVQKVLALAPDPFEKGDSRIGRPQDSGENGQGMQMTSEQIGELLSAPDARISFSLRTPVDETAARPHKAAPPFFSFANDILNLRGPRSYSVLLVYQAGEATVENLVAGNITTPITLQFLAPDRERATAMGQMLFRYSQRTCPN